MPVARNATSHRRWSITPGRARRTCRRASSPPGVTRPAGLAPHGGTAGSAARLDPRVHGRKSLFSWAPRHRRPRALEACWKPGPRFGRTKEDAMKAKVGDRLVIDGTNLGDRRRVGVVTAVTLPDGTPPFVVRW